MFGLELIKGFKAQRVRVTESRLSFADKAQVSTGIPGHGMWASLVPWHESVFPQFKSVDLGAEHSLEGRVLGPDWKVSREEDIKLLFGLERQGRE